MAVFAPLGAHGYTNRGHPKLFLDFAIVFTPSGSWPIKARPATHLGFRARHCNSLPRLLSRIRVSEDEESRRLEFPAKALPPPKANYQCNCNHIKYMNHMIIPADPTRANRLQGPVLYPPSVPPLSIYALEVRGGWGCNWLI